MKYLLILLFLFSSHSFSGELDGKGMLCSMPALDFGYKVNELSSSVNNKACKYADEIQKTK